MRVGRGRVTSLLHRAVPLSGTTEPESLLSFSAAGVAATLTTGNLNPGGASTSATSGTALSAGKYSAAGVSVGVSQVSRHQPARSRWRSRCGRIYGRRRGRPVRQHRHRHELELRLLIRHALVINPCRTMPAAGSCVCPSRDAGAKGGRTAFAEPLRHYRLSGRFNSAATPPSNRWFVDSPVEGGIRTFSSAPNTQRFQVSSETGPSTGAPRFFPSTVSSRPRNRFAVRKFDKPPLTAE
jgi:hypothetical protein